MDQTFLGWFDESKKPMAAKIADGCAAYQRRFGQPATLVWIAQAAPAVEPLPAGVVVERRAGMQAALVYIGQQADAPAPGDRGLHGTA